MASNGGLAREGYSHFGCPMGGRLIGVFSTYDGSGDEQTVGESVQEDYVEVDDD